MFDLSAIHSFGFPALATEVFTLNSFDDLSALPELAEPLIFVGEGSNTVFINNFPGTVVLVRFKGIEIQEYPDKFLVRVGAGENWHELVISLLEKGIYGLENMALIPGTVGAAPIQNIGAYGKEFAQYCHSVTCFELTTAAEVTLSAEQCQFGYRDSIFKRKYKNSHLITSVTLCLPKQWQANNQYGELKSLGLQPSAEQICQKVISIRSAKLPDPKQLGNAGSFFKNPVIDIELYQQLKANWPEMPFYFIDERQVKIPAAWLLDKLGYKGFNYKDVACHIKQPLVLVNNGMGTGPQLLSLARRIIDDVYQNFSIRLHNEVRLIENGLSLEL